MQVDTLGTPSGHHVGCGLFEYTPGLGVLKETAGCIWHLKEFKRWIQILNSKRQGAKIAKKNIFIHFTGTTVSPL